jgi:hypothetical protein
MAQKGRNSGGSRRRRSQPAETDSSGSAWGGIVRSLLSGAGEVGKVVAQAGKVVGEGVLAAMAMASTVRMEDLVGKWEGEISVPQGTFSASMTIHADGSYQGVARVDENESSFRGSIEIQDVLSPTAIYTSSDGTTGKVSWKFREEGERLLKFERDDCSGSSEWSRTKYRDVSP